jgi:malate permease and related proteins
MRLLLVALGMITATAVGIAVERICGEAAQTLARRLLFAMLFGLAPIVVFFNVVHLEFDANVGAGVLLGWIALLVTTTAAWLLTRQRARRPVTGTVMVGALQANTGYLGYPLTALLLGAGRLPQAVAYDLLVGTPALFTIGFAIGAAFGDRAGHDLRTRIRSYVLRNPLLPVFLVALAVPSSLAPDPLVTASRALVFVMLPLGFFAVGIFLAASFPGRLGVPPVSRELATGVVLRLAFAPLLLWLLALPLIDLPGPYLLLAAMPCGVNVLLVVNAYGLDRRLAASMIVWSTALVLIAVLVIRLAGG